VRYSLLSLVLFVLIFTSCEKQNATLLNISITPAVQHAIKQSDEVIPFTIRMSSHVDLSKLIVVETVNNAITDTVLDRAVSGLESTEEWNYTCPNNISNDTLDVKLVFSCYNIDGDDNARAKVFTVIPEDIYLTETSGHTMYSSSSPGFNAYDLLNGIPKYNTDSTSHINDDLDTTSEILSRKWVSLSDLNFTKFNNLNYANATSQSLQQVYESSLKKEFVDDIQAGDIIITVIDNTYIAIKLIYVIDDLGVINDRYEFSIKK
jgi:hypothetical protein